MVRRMPVSVNRKLGPNNRCSPGGAVISPTLCAVVGGDAIVGWTGNSGVMVREAAVDGTLAQLDAAQDAQLHAAGCTKVYGEKQSGAKTDRPELAKLLRRLEPGDVLMVTRLDRLARSTRDLLNILDTIAKAGAGFKSLADPMIDTTSPHGKLILAVLGALAEFERSMILARTDDGRKRAQARGVRFGRPP